MKLKESISTTECMEKAAQGITTYHESRFEFLKEINGIRPGILHALMGLSSSGKSTVLKSVVADTIKSCKVLLWLSEEEAAFYSKGIVEAYIGNDLQQKKKNIVWFEESDDENQEEIEAVKKNPNKAADYIIDVIIQSGCEVVFFDNITTSELYQEFSPQVQSTIIGKIRSFCGKSGVAFFFLTHTSKNINIYLNRLLTSEDVQGSSGVSKKTEVFFILQTFEIASSKVSFINIAKSRPVEGGVKNKFFNLKFSVNKYVGDRPCEFNVLNEAFRLRNKLTER